MKLFKVNTKGLGTFYVVAEDVGKAYQAVRESLDSRDYGFSYQRALESASLEAEEGEYPECGIRLILND